MRRGASGSRGVAEPRAMGIARVWALLLAARLSAHLLSPTESATRDPQTTPTPAPGPIAPAPHIVNAGHDFVLLEWGAAGFEGANTSGLIGYRVFSSYWRRAYTRHYAPELTGTYADDGARLDVCTRRDGVRGIGRLAVFWHSEMSGYAALGTARWSLRQGGYAGHAIFSNGSGTSGPFLWYPHRDGELRMVTAAFGADLGAAARREPRYAPRLDPSPGPA